MRVFVGGASGYIGAAICRSLIVRGHAVLGAARNDATAEKLHLAGVVPVKADLSDAPSFARAAKDADAAIQAASTHDAQSSEYESKAAQAILEGLGGGDKPFVLTSGVWVYGNTGDTPVTEDSPLHPFMLVTWRPAVEQTVLSADKIRGIVIRPAMVYGNAGGMAAMFVGQAKSDAKTVRIPGDGKNRWSLVHVDDLGELYAIALESAPRGGIYNGATDESVTLGDVGAAIAKRHGAEFMTTPIEDARKAMGPFADALALDQVVRSPKSLELGWKPKAISFEADLVTGSYG
ncbi:MAG: NAD-dependent epimerase/dehydratase family protein [Polyangiaceae bacterium]